jgi:hypothetical protein
MRNVAFAPHSVADELRWDMTGGGRRDESDDVDAPCPVAYSAEIVLDRARPYGPASTEARGGPTPYRECVWPAARPQSRRARLTYGGPPRPSVHSRRPVRLRAPDRAHSATVPTYRPNPAVVETDLGDELILLDPATRQMFSLNATGRVVWRALAEGGRDAAVEQVTATFEIEAAAARADVDALLARLAESGLVQAIPAAAGGDGAVVG